MARKPKAKTKIKIEKLPKDEQLNEEELKKVSGGTTKPGSGAETPSIDCWGGAPKLKP